MITQSRGAERNDLKSADMVESSTPDASTAVASVVVDADTPTVFSMFTQPTRLASWFWPASYSAVYRLDARPGGTFTFRSTGLPPGKNVGVRGIYGKIRRPELLTFIWSWDRDRAPATQVSVELRPKDDRTEVVVTHAENLTEEQRDNHLKGWNDCLSRLADHLAIS